MNDLFGANYAAAYDQLYGDKDYTAEVDLLEHVFRCYSPLAVKRVLDLGCGTGNHAVPLAQRGYAVVGVDRSAEMLRQAGERASAARFVLGDITSTQLDGAFDAVLMMFAVLGYQTRNCEAQAALSTARRHLATGGLLFADVWYGPAVLAQRPSDRVKVIDAFDGGQLIRVASSALDTHGDVCTVRYHLWRIVGGRVQAEVREEHPMRYFFEPELELLLSHVGFKLERVGAFPRFFEEEPSEETWNVAFAARAI